MAPTQSREPAAAATPQPHTQASAGPFLRPRFKREELRYWQRWDRHYRRATNFPANTATDGKDSNDTSEGSQPHDSDSHSFSDFGSHQDFNHLPGNASHAEAVDHLDSDRGELNIEDSDGEYKRTKDIDDTGYNDSEDRSNLGESGTSLTLFNGDSDDGDSDLRIRKPPAPSVYTPSPSVVNPSESSSIGSEPSSPASKRFEMSAGYCLITGGAGYIGSFTALALLEAGYEVFIVDNLYNSSKEALNRIERICGKKPTYYDVDITDEEGLDEVFKKHPKIDSVIHFAALKAVGESGEIPLDYYKVNVQGTLTLLRAAKENNVTNIVYSSSATVYGDATRFKDMIPIPEKCPLGPTNPYGNTKYCCELMIGDYIRAERAQATKKSSETDAKKYNAALLRYFNPAGSHPTGIMGEDPQGIPFNLLPLLAQVATGKRKELMVYGDDYDSHDGTAIRDYIHILDLAQGHLAALNYLRDKNPGVEAWNLGTGRGSTVFDMVKAFSKAVGRDLPYKVVERRAGDVLDLTSNPNKANSELGWKAKRTMEDACVDLWRWTENNPQGYRQDPPKELLERLEKLKAEGKLAMKDSA